MDWAAAKEALSTEFDTRAERQKSMRRFKTTRMEPGCEPTVFFASPQVSLDWALPGLDRMSRQQLLSDQFVECVQPALRAHLRAVTQATIQAVFKIDGKRELCSIDTGTAASLRRRGKQAECKPDALAMRAVGGYRQKIDGLSIHSMCLGDKSVQRAFLISPGMEQTNLEQIFTPTQGILVTKYGAVKLAGYLNTAVSELRVRKIPSCRAPSVQSVVEEYSELFTGDEDPLRFRLWIGHEIHLSSNPFDLTAPKLGIKQLRMTTYHPETRGLAERDDRTTKEWLTAKGAHRAPIQRTTGKSPFMVLYLRHPRLPGDQENGLGRATRLPTEELGEESRKARENFTAVQERIREKTASRKVRQFPIGAKVKWKDHQNLGNSGLRSRKLGSGWEGPFVVADRRRDVYTIQDGRGSRIVNATQPQKGHDTPEERPNRPAACSDLTEINGNRWDTSDL
ncbi:hypothetical protein CLF_107028 [Clonorchis sinensis]|uniref:Gap-Pol polyprotein n=1 Tax=Clonorchis sinensis TaxID=79923 RepID=G7YQC0_CLOSI|nr:hypothetical protein CLF_107028 [Clonorchis sinensis]